jgi:hypothetical protein
MLAFLADGDVLFIFSFTFWTGDIAHSAYFTFYSIFKNRLFLQK